jgi:multidrug efflux pump subunit AcrA (membrane-fusion protein)
LAAQRRLEVIDTEKQEVRAALAQAVADRDLAQLNLGFTELRAPIDGMVGNRSARTGAYATVGAQLISLVPAHGLWVDANFKESQLAQIRPGDWRPRSRPMCCVDRRFTGTSPACATILNDRANLHFLRLAEHLNTANSAMADLLQRVTAADMAKWGGDAVHGHAAALKQLWSLTRREAQTQTFADAFLVIGACFLVATLMVPLTRKVAPPAASSADAH